MKKNLFFVLVFISFSRLAIAIVWTTTAAGYWSNPAIWVGGVVPPSSTSDSFKIKHPVILTTNITVTSASFFKIDSSGGICGHHKITMGPGTVMIKEGVLELDSLYIPGGNVYCNAPGPVVLTYNGFVSSGGTLSISGCSFSVGPWFNCVSPQYDGVGAGVEEFDEGQMVQVFPNPCTKKLNISISKTGEQTSIELFDVLGKCIYRRSNINSDLEISMVDFPKGIYYLRLTIGINVLSKKVVRQ